jgi:hypothetical protein
MAKEKKEKQAAKAKGPRKSGKYKTVKTQAGEVKAAAPKKKEKAVVGPICSLSCLCKYAKVRKLDKVKEERRCSIGIVPQGNCNYPKWGKHLPATF